MINPALFCKCQYLTAEADTYRIYTSVGKVTGEVEWLTVTARNYVLYSCENASANVPIPAFLPAAQASRSISRDSSSSSSSNKVQNFASGGQRLWIQRQINS